MAMGKVGRWMILLAAVLTGCAMPPVQTAGSAEIPEEVLEALDEDVLQTLVEAPKYVALTFDDGPRADTTKLLLNGLRERGVAATFFVVGEQIAGNEALIRRMKEEGHQIGNHTYSHVRLTKAEKDTVIEEIHKTEVLLTEIVGQGSYWLRPPYGRITAAQTCQIHTPMIYWTLDPQDWKLLDAEKVTECVTAQVQPGDIILLHDFYPSSVDAALEIIDRLQAEGYAFVTVEELFRIKGVEPEDGVLYAAPEKIRQPE